VNNKDVVSDMKFHFFQTTYDFLGDKHNGPPNVSRLPLCTSSRHQGGGRPSPCSVMVIVDDASLFCRGSGRRS